MVMKIEAGGTATAVTATADTATAAASLRSLYRAGIFLLLFLPNTGTKQTPWPLKMSSSILKIKWFVTSSISLHPVIILNDQINFLINT
jgi:hypothetical protein